ncbi:YihY/virulence factor BrkB family protein [Iodidimonas sp. SYSU 1G8]|uniref:YihY/virulence factor BrkB family protein n=1 Tax=Iodidimonas sp. SYSU 1G8 TaxID=3133967 RepID=UPI0031FF234F
MQRTQRSRRTDAPFDIPLTGWKSILRRLYQELWDDRVLLAAAGVTYYGIMALVPSLSAVVSIYGLFFDATSAAGHLRHLDYVVPGGAIEIAREQVLRLASEKNGTLGTAFVVSLALALWSANAGMKAVFEAMNIAYDRPEKRGFFKLTAITLAFTLVGIVILLMLVGAIVAVPITVRNLGFDGPFMWAVAAAIYAVALLLIAIAVTALYRWGPSRPRAGIRWIAPGTITTVVLVSILSVGFSWYTANFGSYDKIYGSLGALIGFMSWMWMSIAVLIVGGELNSEIERHANGADGRENDEPAA